jgi:hypothetical protein
VCLVALVVALSACSSNAESGPYPSGGPMLSGVAEASYPTSLSALIAESDAIPVVRPDGSRSEVWNPTETFVSSRLGAEVVTMLKGALAPGDHVVLYAPGGLVKRSFGATSRRRPAPGDETSLEEYVDWPFFKRGVEELVFLKLITPEPGTGLAPFYYNLGPAARFRVDGQKLSRIYPKGVEIDDPGKIQEQLVGKTVDDVRALVGDNP